MQAQNRLVPVPTRQIALAATLVVAVALLVLVLFTGVLRTVEPHTTIGTQTVISHEQAPDAIDRNDAYARVQSSEFDNQSPDARDRNIQLSGR